jgi:hypothetical protein
MVELLRDPLTRSVVAIAAIIISTLVTITLFYLTQKLRRKELTCNLSTTRLTAIHKDYASRIQVLFDGTPAPDTTLVLARISNTGNEPLKAEDFAEPLRLRMPPGAKVLTADVTETRPQTLMPSLRVETIDSGRRTEHQRVIEAQEVVLNPLLLNRGDEMLIKVLTSHMHSEDVLTLGRIVGVTDIKTRPERVATGITGLLAGYLIALVLGIFSNLLYDVLGRPNAVLGLISQFITVVFMPLIAFILGYLFVNRNRPDPR